MILQRLILGPICALSLCLVGCVQVSKDAYYEPESSPHPWNCNHWNGSESCQVKVNDASVSLDIADRSHRESWIGLLVPLIPVPSGGSGTPDPNVLNVTMCWNLKSGENIAVDAGDIAVVQDDGKRLQPQEIADRMVSYRNGTVSKRLIDRHVDTMDSKCIYMLFKSSAALDAFSLAVPKLSISGISVTPDPLAMRLKNGTHYDAVPVM